MIRRWQDGTPVGKVCTGDLEQRFGDPFIQLHRGDLCTALYNAVMDQGVACITGKRMIDIDMETPEILFEDQKRVTADLVVAADGMFCFEAHNFNFLGLGSWARHG